MERRANRLEPPMTSSRPQPVTWTLLSLTLTLMLTIALGIVAPRPAEPKEPDQSLRIGTFNAWMLPDQGILIAPFYVAGVPVCAVGELTPEPPLWCEVGQHPVYDSDQIDAGAKALANRIIKSGYDVIVLNEVFDESAQSILRSKLWNDYPYAITFVDEWGGTDQDSGLQLFSKFPFEKITPNYSGQSAYNDFDADIYYSGTKLIGSAIKSYMAFMPFGGDCDGDDCWSNKGVGYVRLRNPDTSRIHHVFFTHMQATYKEDVLDDPDTWQGLEVREKQFRRLKEFIERGMAPATNAIVPTREDIFILGDLNVDGDLSDSKNSLGDKPWNNKGEWTKYFNSHQFENGFFATSFIDTWAKQHPIRDTLLSSKEADDFGITHGNGDCLSDGSGGEPGESVDGCRWDYILYNAPLLGSRALCNQHPSLALNLLYAKPYGEVANHRGGRKSPSDGLGGSPDSAHWMSDHTGLNGNFNVLFEQCSPLLPKSAKAVYGPHPVAGKSYGAKTLSGAGVGNTADGSVDFNNPGTLEQGTLVAPGSVQWFRVTEPGSYLIGFWDDSDPSHKDTSYEIGYRFQVFQSGNLSVPVKDYKGEEWTTHVMGLRGLPVPIKGPKYILNEPPYYIKVYHPEQQHKDLPFNSQGKYWIGIHRLDCSNKYEESCPVVPAMLQSYQFPANQVVQSYPTPESLYFNVHVQQLTVPDDQFVQFILSGYGNDVLTSTVTTNDPNVDVAECDEGDPCDVKQNLGFDDRLAEEGLTTGSVNGICPSGPGPMGNSDFTGCNNVISWNVPQPADDTRELFWRVTRTGPLVKTAFDVTWTTDLTAFYGDQFSGATGPILLHSHELTDDVSPHDEIRMGLVIDGVLFGPGVGDNGFEIGDYADDMDKYIDGNISAQVKLPIKFKSGIEVAIIEYDDVSDNEVTYDTVSSLAEGIGPRSNEQRKHIHFYWDDGHYELSYNVSRGTQAYEKPDP
jgi:Endonuclease/Exonuclease/phosphatase family